MNKIVARECRTIFHAPAKPGVNDTHVVKEILHYEDGTSKKNLRTIENFTRPFWITKEHYRNHEQTKESESLDRVTKYMATETDLARSAAVRLGSRYVGVDNLRKVKTSPFVYGLDISSSTHIRYLYLEKYSKVVTPYEVCIFDIEADVILDEITIISIATKTKLYTVVTKRYLQQKATNEIKLDKIHSDVSRKLDYLYDKHIPKTELSQGVTRELCVVDTELELITKVLAMAHKWQPDVMVVWNIRYDINKMLDVLKKNDVDPATVFCDPNIPDNLKSFRFKEGPLQKLTASGKHTPINMESQWHTVLCPASFYWLDGSCVHRFIRAGGKEVPGGYGLDNILKHELGDALGKLKFPDKNTRAAKGVDWHKYMTAERPLEYIIYNQWDVLSVLQLDDKTKDIHQVMPMLSGLSNYDIFNSGPKRINDAMHYFYLSNGEVLGTKDPTASDKDLLGLGGWIVMLPSCRISERGTMVIDGGGNRSNVRLLAYDSDQVSGLILAPLGSNA